MVSKKDSTEALVDEARKKLSVAQADAQELESRLENARDRVQKYKSFLAVLDEFTQNGVRRRPDPEVVESVGPQSLSAPDLTIADAAEHVLRLAGEPLKNRVMAERMLDRGFPYKKDVTRLRDSVGTILDRKASSGDTFVKHAPGFFGLIEWEEE